MSISPKKNEMTLVGVLEELCEHWKEAFKDFPAIQVYFEAFQEVKEYDCLLSHLLQQGLSLRDIQSLLEHSSSKTTEIYTQSIESGQ